MKTDDKTAFPRVRIAVIGMANVGKSGELNIFLDYFVDVVPSIDSMLDDPESNCLIKCHAHFPHFHFVTALTVRYLTRRFIGEYRSKTDLLYRQTVSTETGLCEVEIVDVSTEVEGFPLEQIQWADSVLIAYSIVSRESFKYATQMLVHLKQLQSAPSAYLIGNKADLDHLREVGSLTHTQQSKR